MSFKRRRGIGLRRWLVAALKDYAKREGVPSHTTAVNRILRGKLDPIRDYDQYKKGGDDSKQGVSMPEELWLALKDYGQRRDKDESDTKVACKILVGKIDSIPHQSIEEGRRLARQREIEREREAMGAKSSVDPSPSDSDNRPLVFDTPQEAPEISQEEIILQERETEGEAKDKRPLSQGVPVTEKIFEKKINPDDDSYGGVFNL